MSWVKKGNNFLIYLDEVKAASNLILATCVCPECMNIKDRWKEENPFPDPAVGLEKMKMAEDWNTTSSQKWKGICSFLKWSCRDVCDMSDSFFWSNHPPHLLLLTHHKFHKSNRSKWQIAELSNRGFLPFRKLNAMFAISSNVQHLQTLSWKFFNFTQLTTVNQIFQVCFKIKLNREKYTEYERLSSMRSCLNYSENLETGSSTKCKTFPLIRGSTSTDAGRLGGGKASANPSPRYLGKTKIIYCNTVYQTWTSTTILKYFSFQNTNMSVFSDFLNNIRYTFFKRENVRLLPRCRWCLRSSASLRSESVTNMEKHVISCITFF